MINISKPALRNLLLLFWVAPLWAVSRMAWATWRGHFGLLEELAATLVVLSVVWCCFCTVVMSVSYDKLNSKLPQPSLWGPRPKDSHELRVWMWIQRFKWGVISIVVFMVLRAVLVEIRLH